MNENVKDYDLLLVKEKNDDQLRVAGMSKDGKVESYKPDKLKNTDFLKIGANDSALESFFENFMRQAKDPTRWEHFRVPAQNLNETIQLLNAALSDAFNPQNSAFLEKHRVEPKLIEQQQSQKPSAIDPNLVNWEKFEKFGITRTMLEKSEEIDKLLDYRKTGLLPITIKLADDMQPLRTDGRLVLRQDDDGKFSPYAHLIRHQPNLERPYFGVHFTEEDKKNLLTTGNLGRVVEAEFKQGVKTPIYLSLDKLTNELVAYRKELVRVPDTYKGVTLSAVQKQEALDGKKVEVKGMISKSGTPLPAPAYIQFSADKRFFELIIDNKKQKQTQTTPDEKQHEKQEEKKSRGRKM